jgi:hypothetical protein
MINKLKQFLPLIVASLLVSGTGTFAGKNDPSADFEDIFKGEFPFKNGNPFKDGFPFKDGPFKNRTFSSVIQEARNSNVKNVIQESSSSNVKKTKTKNGRIKKHFEESTSLFRASRGKLPQGKMPHVIDVRSLTPEEREILPSIHLGLAANPNYTGTIQFYDPNNETLSFRDFLAQKRTDLKDIYLAYDLTQKTTSSKPQAKKASKETKKEVKKSIKNTKATTKKATKDIKKEVKNSIKNVKAALKQPPKKETAVAKKNKRVELQKKRAEQRQVANNKKAEKKRLQQEKRALKAKNKPVKRTHLKKK